MQIHNSQIVVLISILIATFSTGCRQSDPRFMSPLGVGADAPEILAAGWLNGTPDDMSGKVVVVDCWGFW